MTAPKRPAPSALPVQYRTLGIERDDTRDAKDDRIPIAISSEEPVRRWFGVEILGHGAGEIDLSRAKGNGLPLLLGHNTDEHIGRVEDVALGKDGKLRGLMRFGRSAKAQEARQDVLDGIRTDISVGYRINELKLVTSTDDEDTYRATNWGPMESSLVSVPADITVGVGRNAETTEYPVTVVPPTLPAPQARSEPVPENNTAAPGADPPTRNYAQDYVEIENMVKSANLGRSEPIVSDDERRGFIERGMTPDQVAKELATKIDQMVAVVPGKRS